MSRLRDVDALADFFGALSMPVRLAIVARVASAPCSIADLAAELGIAPGVASKHTTILRRAGVLEVRRAGSRSECHLARPEVVQWCEALTERPLSSITRLAEPEPPRAAKEAREGKKRRRK